MIGSREMRDSFGLFLDAFTRGKDLYALSRLSFCVVQLSSHRTYFSYISGGGGVGIFVKTPGKSLG